jgi:hypothetical protein
MVDKLAQKVIPKLKTQCPPPKKNANIYARTIQITSRHAYDFVKIYLAY